MPTGAKLPLHEIVCIGADPRTLQSCFINRFRLHRKASVKELPTLRKQLVLFSRLRLIHRKFRRLIFDHLAAQDKDKGPEGDLRATQRVRGSLRVGHSVTPIRDPSTTIS